MSTTKNFYENLYKDKQDNSYREKYEKKRQDLLHKYFLFWLNPYKNTRHQVVANILPAGQKILDIGCWDGNSTILYGAFKKFKEVYGVDITSQAILEAKSKGIKAQVVDLNQEKLPFLNDFFDVITLVAVLEHLIDPHFVLAEVRRLLKANGYLIVCVPNVASLSNRIRILLGQRPRTSFDDGWDGGHLLYFTPKDLKKLLSEYGFSVTAKYTTGNLPFLRRMLFNFTGEFIFKCQLKK